MSAIGDVSHGPGRSSAMSCTPLSDAQRKSLTEFAEGVEPYDPEIVEELRRWGWVMRGSLELTGAGRIHTVENPSGGVLGSGD